MANRRSFLLGIGAALAAPAVVRAESLMKIAVLQESVLNSSALLQVIRSVGPMYAYDRAMLLGWSPEMIQSNLDVPPLPLWARHQVLMGETNA